MINEDEGRAILKDVFSSRGYEVLESYEFVEGGITFEADGWDPSARVGYEYMTMSEQDHEDLEPDTLLRLNEWTDAGKLAFLFIDETDIEDGDDLAQKAHGFLDAVEKRRGKKPAR